MSDSIQDRGRYQMNRVHFKGYNKNYKSQVVLVNIFPTVQTFE